MASTPSASALSAVLRCKRPPASAYRLGLTYGAVQSSPRAEQPDKTERRSALCGFIFIEARVSVCVQSAELRARNTQRSQINYLCNFHKRTKSGLHEDTSNTSSKVSPAETKVEPSDCGGLCTNVLLRVTDFLSVNLTSLSEPDKVLCVSVVCKNDHKVASVSRDTSHHNNHHSLSVLKSHLLHFTMCVSDFVITKLGFVWKKVPVSVNQLMGCDKCISVCGGKNKTKKAPKPGT